MLTIADMPAIRERMVSALAKDLQAMDPCEAPHGPRLTFGQRLRQLRQAQGLSQRSLAAIVRTDHTYLSKLENGKADGRVSRQLVKRLAKALFTSAEELCLLAGYVPDDILEWLLADPGHVVAVRQLMRDGGES